MTESESDAMKAAATEDAHQTPSAPPTPGGANWGAVWALGIGVASLAASEMMPMSLLTPLAHDLQVTEGVAGQAITASAIVAVLTSLFLAPLIGNLDRRKLLLVLSLLQVLSNLVVAIAPNMVVVMIARLILGVAVGGFWGMSSALALRLAPPGDVPKAFSIIFGGGSVAAIVAAPLGAFFGGMVGWRGVFYGAAALSLVALLTQLRTLPSMPVHTSTRLSGLWHVLKEPKVALGMVGVLLVFGGRQTNATYLRPFLEKVTLLNFSGVSILLFLLGVGVFVGNTFFAARLLKRNLHLTISGLTLFMAVLGGALLLFGASPIAVGLIILVWGMSTGVTTVGWSTWLTRVVPHRAESGGGVLVAVIQGSIMAGAAAGGIAIDTIGPRGPVILAMSILLIGAVHCWFVLADHKHPIT